VVPRTFIGNIRRSKKTGVARWTAVVKMVALVVDRGATYHLDGATQTAAHGAEHSPALDVSVRTIRH